MCELTLALFDPGVLELGVSPDEAWRVSVDRVSAHAYNWMAKTQVGVLFVQGAVALLLTPSDPVCGEAPDCGAQSPEPDGGASR